MEIFRTPDERFAGLTAFPWEPAYAEVPDGDGGSLRVAYVDAGPEGRRVRDRWCCSCTASPPGPTSTAT